MASLAVKYSVTVNELDKKRHTLMSQFRLLGNPERVRPTYTVEPLITDTAGEFKFCPL
jgi:hypothetical protein